jgi:adenylate kinase family enzyme
MEPILNKIIIFGNSGSGKPTLANKLSITKDLAHLDLDTIAWQAGSPPTRKALEDSQRDINAFVQKNSQWVIEGCYSDLLVFAMVNATEVIYLDLPIATCIDNAKSRPWEPHKYPSKQVQDQNLAMLVDWINQYNTRQDTFSKSAHESLFQGFNGKKTRIDENR